MMFFFQIFFRKSEKLASVGMEWVPNKIRAFDKKGEAIIVRDRRVDFYY